MKTTMVLMEEWSQCPTLGPKMTHPMPKKWTRKEVAMANYLRVSNLIPRMIPRIRRILQHILLLRNPSVADFHQRLPVDRHRLCPWNRSLSRLITIPCPIPLRAARLDSGAHVSNGPMFRVGIRIRSQNLPFRMRFPESWRPLWPTRKLRSLRKRTRKRFLIFD
jgi:hypothetical protein